MSYQWSIVKEANWRQCDSVNRSSDGDNEMGDLMVTVMTRIQFVFLMVMSKSCWFVIMMAVMFIKS